MKKLRNYAKPYLPAIALAICLLFLRANADLALPDYLSNIVNVGIQQGGVEDPVPEQLSHGLRTFTLTFLVVPSAISSRVSLRSILRSVPRRTL